MKNPEVIMSSALPRQPFMVHEKTIAAANRKARPSGRAGSGVLW